MTRPYVFKCNKEKVDNVEKVRRFIIDNPGSMVADVVSYLGKSETVTHVAMKALRESGFLFRQLRANKGYYYSMEYAVKESLPVKISIPYKKGKTIAPVYESSRLNDMLRLNRLWPARSKVYSA